MTVGPELSGPTIASLHFVHRQQYTMPDGALTQPLHESTIGRHKPAFSLNRLYKHGRSFFRCTVSRKDVIQLSQTKVGCGLIIPAITKTVWKRCHYNAAHHRLHSGTQAGIGRGHGKRPHGAAMKTAMEHHDIGPCRR